MGDLLLALLILAFVGIPALRLWHSRRRACAQRLAREAFTARLHERAAASTRVAVQGLEELGEKMRRGDA